MSQNDSSPTHPETTYRIHHDELTVSTTDASTAEDASRAGARVTASTGPSSRPGCTWAGCTDDAEATVLDDPTGVTAVCEQHGRAAFVEGYTVVSGVKEAQR